MKRELRDMRWGATAIASYSQVSVLAITYSPYVEVYVSLRGLEICLDFYKVDYEAKGSTLFAETLNNIRCRHKRHRSPNSLSSLQRECISVLNSVDNNTPPCGVPSSVGALYSP